MKHLLCALALVICAMSCSNQSVTASQSQQTAKKVDASTLVRVYDDEADPISQIDNAIKAATVSGRNVICQVGGNWCRWCLMFSDFITSDEDIAKLVGENFEYVHVNVRHKNPETGKNEIYSEAMAKLGNPMRFGYPVLVVLDSEGNVLHIQDSSYLEDGDGYDKEKVVRFFKNWTVSAVKGE